MDNETKNKGPWYALHVFNEDTDEHLGTAFVWGGDLKDIHSCIAGTPLEAEISQINVGKVGVEREESLMQDIKDEEAYRVLPPSHPRIVSYGKRKEIHDAPDEYDTKKSGLWYAIHVFNKENDEHLGTAFVWAVDAKDLRKTLGLFPDIYETAFSDPSVKELRMTIEASLVQDFEDEEVNKIIPPSHIKMVEYRNRVMINKATTAQLKEIYKEMKEAGLGGSPPFDFLKSVMASKELEAGDG